MRDLTDSERRQLIAKCLGYYEYAPETWPDAIIERLIELWDARGERMMMEEIRKMLSKR